MLEGECEMKRPKRLYRLCLWIQYAMVILPRSLVTYIRMVLNGCISHVRVFTRVTTRGNPAATPDC